MSVLTSQSPSLPPQSLTHLVELVDARLSRSTDSAILRFMGDPPQVDVLALNGEHPLDFLLGYEAPAKWHGIGLHCQGRGYDLPDPPGTRCSTFASEALDAVPVNVTILLDRGGHGRGILRAGDVRRWLDGPPEGVVGDACRRALGLATAPPPADTVGLWLRVWLDRVVETAMKHGDGGPLDWPRVIDRHPDCAGIAAPCDPEAVAEATRALADRWPWPRLRSDPDVVDTAEPPLERRIALWMDDGMFARWLTTELPDLGFLAACLPHHLTPDARSHLTATFRLCGHPLPEEDGA